MSTVIATAAVNCDDLERKFRPALPATIVVLHLGVASIAYETQRHFYARLHAANLGYGLLDIALQPTTFAVTAAIAAVVAAAYLASRRLGISRVVVSVAALVASVAMTMAALGVDADSKAVQVEAGRPACSGNFTPYRLCAQLVFVSGVSGVDMSWPPGGQALYLGDWGHRYVLIDPASHKTFSVSQQDVALAFPLR